MATRWVICTGPSKRRNSSTAGPTSSGRRRKQGELLGRAQQRQHAVADQVHRRLVARHQQQLGERDDLARP